MMKVILTAVLFLYSMLSISTAYAQVITVFTAKLPPFTLSKDKKGISHEIMENIAGDLGLEISIVYLPWKRAQKVAQETQNSMIMTMVRSAAREEKYNWIAPFLEIQTAFISLSSPINSFNEAMAQKRIAVLAGTPRKRALEKLSFKNLEIVNGTETAARLLNHRRVDAWYTFIQRAAFVYKSEGFDPGSLVLGKPTEVADLWLATNKTFDSALAAKIKTAVENFRTTDKYQAILEKYTK